MGKHILLISGNKRSGSTHLMRLLNLHPQVHVTNESDVLWILHQYHALKTSSFQCYHIDGDVGMLRALEVGAEALSKTRNAYDNFIAFQEKVFERENKSEKKFEGLRYVGDQKPHQNADRNLLSTLIKDMPSDAKLKVIHLYRHPFDAIDSSKVFKAKRNGLFTDEYILDKWITVEKNYSEALSELKFDCLDVHYDDVLRSTSTVMEQIFQFLELDCEPEVLFESRFKTFRKFNQRKIPVMTPAQEETIRSMGFTTRNSDITRKAIKLTNSLRAETDFHLTRIKRVTHMLRIRF